MYAILIVTEVEMAIDAWRVQRGAPRKLSRYARAKPGERLTILKECVPTLSSGENADGDVLADFIAIKLLRNRLIHTDPETKGLVEERGFPADVRQLNCDHLSRIREVSDLMRGYLAEPLIRANLPAMTPPT